MRCLRAAGYRQVLSDYNKLNGTVGCRGMTMISRFLPVTAALALLACSGIASAAYPEDPYAWKFDAQIYLWGAGMKVKTITDTEVDVSFGDLLDNLDMAFMGTFGAQKGKWSALGDVIYLDLEKKENGVTPGPGQQPVDAKLGLKGWIISLYGGYALVQSERNALNLAVGARYLDLDTKLKVNQSDNGTSLVDESIPDSGWDGVIGLQGQAGFAQNWYFNYLLDVGTGNSDFTWQALAGLGYAWNTVDVKFGYRHLAWEFDDSDAFSEVITDLEVSGPYAGVKFKF